MRTEPLGGVELALAIRAAHRVQEPTARAEAAARHRARPVHLAALRQHRPLVRREIVRHDRAQALLGADAANSEDRVGAGAAGRGDVRTRRRHWAASLPPRAPGNSPPLSRFRLLFAVLALLALLALAARFPPLPGSRAGGVEIAGDVQRLATRQFAASVVPAKDHDRRAELTLAAHNRWLVPRLRHRGDRRQQRFGFALVGANIRGGEELGGREMPSRVARAARPFLHRGRVMPAGHEEEARRHEWRRRW